jgi:hypothetical protein
MGTITKWTIFGLFAQTKPNVLVLWSDVSNRATKDVLSIVDIFASYVAKWLRMRSATTTPFVGVIFGNTDFTWFLIISHSKL